MTSTPPTPDAPASSGPGLLSSALSKPLARTLALGCLAGGSATLVWFATRKQSDKKSSPEDLARLADLESENGEYKKYNMRCMAIMNTLVQELQRMDAEIRRVAPEVHGLARKKGLLSPLAPQAGSGNRRESVAQFEHMMKKVEMTSKMVCDVLKKMKCREIAVGTIMSEKEVEVKELTQKFESLQRKLKETSTELTKAYGDNRKLQAALDHEIQSHKDLTASMNLKVDEYSERARQVEELHQKEKEAHQELTARMNEYVEKVSERANKSREKFAVFRQKSAGVEQDFEALKSKHKALIDENKSLSEKANALTVNQTYLQTKVSTLEAEITENNSTLKFKQIRITHLESEVKENSHIITDRDNHIQRQESSINKLEQDAAQLKEHLALAKKEAARNGDAMEQSTESDLSSRPTPAQPQTQGKSGRKKNRRKKNKAQTGPSTVTTES